MMWLLAGATETGYNGSGGAGRSYVDPFVLYLMAMSEMENARQAGMTAREFAMSKGVPSTLTDAEAAQIDALEYNMRTRELPPGSENLKSVEEPSPSQETVDKAWDERKTEKSRETGKSDEYEASWNDGEDGRRNVEGAGNATAKASNKTIVIGETMVRVKKYAAEIGAETYKEFKYYDKTKALFGEKLANFIGGVDNALWLIGKMVQKYKIVDLGLDMKRVERSPYYLMESVLAYLYKYKDYAEDFMKGAF